jgi:DNA-binding transcriptional regulator YhcF (GntR family)
VELSINVMSKVPAYVQLAEQIMAGIDAGELKPGDKIPSFKELMDQTGLAMATVQKAVKRLEHANYVFAVSGMGTFVNSRTWVPHLKRDQRHARAAADPFKRQ